MKAHSIAPKRFNSSSPSNISNKNTANVDRHFERSVLIQTRIIHPFCTCLWREAFSSISSFQQLAEFPVLCQLPDGSQKQEYKLNDGWKTSLLPCSMDKMLYGGNSLVN